MSVYIYIYIYIYICIYTYTHTYIMKYSSAYYMLRSRGGRAARGLRAPAEVGQVGVARVLIIYYISGISCIYIYIYIYTHTIYLYNYTLIIYPTIILQIL